MGDLASYEVYAVQYAYRPDRPRSETFVSNAWTDPMHDTLQPIGYFVWAIVGSDRTVVVDTGFDADEAERRRAGSGDRWRPELACTPAEGLSMIAIDALAVKEVIITHLHFDHAGTLSHFPAARFHLQELEMRYATGPHMGHDYFSGAYTIDHVIDMVGHVYQGRVVFHQGDAEIAPGVSVHHVGGHTMGMQFVRVRTKRGWVVLASDASHFYDNFEGMAPYPIVFNVADMLKGFERMQSLATSRAHIIPGHDPLVMSKYPSASDATRGVIVRLDVDPTHPAK